MIKDAKHKILLDASDLRLLRHPRKEMRVQASEIQAKNADFSKLFPKDAKPDITYVQGVSFSIGHINANDCLILPEEGMQSYSSMAETPLDIEHNRQEIIGFAIKSFLCNVKNSKVLSEDDAWEILDSKGIVNVGAVFGIWRINNPELDELIQENFDAQSENYDTVKISFEYYFDNYDFFVSNGSNNYPDGTIVSGDEAKNPLSPSMFSALRINGGSGLWNGERLSIVPLGGFTGGNAITFRPANKFSDLLAKKNGDTVTPQKEERAINAEETKIDKNAENCKNCENSKIINLSSVNTNEVKIMDKDQTISTQVATTAPAAAPAPVQTVEASTVVATAPQLSVDKDVANALQKSLDTKIEELNAKDNQMATLKASVEKLEKDAKDSQELSKQIQAKYDEAMTKLQEVEAHRVAEAQKAKVAERISKMAEAIEITDDNRAILESEAATLSDEDFAKKIEFYSKLAKRVDASVKTDAPASVKTTVQEVVTQAAAQTAKVDIVTAPQGKSLAEQFKEAFGTPENFGFKTN